METSKRTRRRFSEKQQDALVAEWQQSGQSAYAFGKTRDVGAGSLIRWKERRLRQASRSETKMSFLPLQVVDDGPVADGVAPVIAQVVVGKLRIQFFASAPQADVRHLMQALMEVQL